VKVAEHFYIYLWDDERENNCNSIFIDGKVPVLIDPGHLHKVKDLFARMRSDGVDPTRVRVVLATHGHPDHFSSTAAFASESVKIGLSKEDEIFINDIGKPMYAQYRLDPSQYRVDFYLRDGDLILGKHEFQMIATPGHTPGGLCIYWPRYRVLFPGDLVFYKGVGRVDFPGGDLKALKQSIDVVSRLPVEIIIPGHGQAVQGGPRVRANFEFIRKMLA
jgi:hydroxyacylglutathione hydrolase